MSNYQSAISVEGRFLGDQFRNISDSSVTSFAFLVCETAGLVFVGAPQRQFDALRNLEKTLHLVQSRAELDSGLLSATAKAIRNSVTGEPVNKEEWLAEVSNDLAMHSD